MAHLRIETTRHLHQTTLGRQRDGRLPGVYAGVARGGELVWGEGLGTVSVDSTDTPGPDDQFLIASNTKSFVAVLIMALRDEGRLSLDDLISEHVSELSNPVTVRQALAHVSGMQREPVGDVWETLDQPDGPALLAGLEEAERIGRPHERWHYSNLMYAVLGQLVERVEARPWFESVTARILDPLEMTRTTVGFEGGSHLAGYFVGPYDDVPRPEPVLDFRAMAPVGGLASTAHDLARWCAFVADPVADVLSADTVEEMCQPQVLVDTDGWTQGMGLGFFLVRAASGRVYAGHTGGMPGHITGVFTHRESGTGGIVAMTNTDAPPPDIFAVELADHVVAHDPVEPEPWRPGSAVPPEYADLLGVWFSEGRGFTFSVRRGELEARMDGAPAHRPPSRFEEVAHDVYRTVAGRERGELLRVTRDESGSPRKLNWATYLFTRRPQSFGEDLMRS